MEKRIIFLFVWSLLCHRSVIGQRMPEPLTSVRFTLLTGGIVIVQGLLNEQYNDTLNFLLDTGSGGISIDSATADRLKLPLVQTEKILRGIGGTRKVPFAYRQTLRLNTLMVDSLDFHINDYSLLTSVYGVKIDGIIGYSFLKRFVVQVNYDSLRISVYQPGNFRYPGKGYTLKPYLLNIPVHKLEVEDARAVVSRFLLDTGAGLCVVLNERLAADSALLKKGRKLYDAVTEGLGGKAEMQLTVIRKLQIGPYRFKNVPAYLFNDHTNVTMYPSTAGLLGNDILRRFNLVINYPEEAIFLKPNGSFHEPFDYSYTGMSLYVTAGQIMVGDVMHASPAEAAGILPGDRIVAVDEWFNNDIQAYKVALQKADSRHRLILVRNGELLERSLYITSIL